MQLKILGLALFLAAAWMLFSCRSGPGTGSALRVNLRDTLSIKVRLPPGYDSTRDYPVIIGLHGRGSSADRLLELWPEISGRDLVYIVPEGPYPFANGSAWFRNRPHDSLRIARDRARSEGYIAEIAIAALDRFGGSKAYMLGFSQGGNLAYHTGLRYRELFQGIIAFGAYLDTETLSPEKTACAEGLKVFVAHGEEYRIIPFREGAAAHRNLGDMGCEAEFRRFPGGHRVDVESLAMGLDWMIRSRIR